MAICDCGKVRVNLVVAEGGSFFSAPMERSCRQRILGVDEFVRMLRMRLFLAVSSVFDIRDIRSLYSLFKSGSFD